MERKELERVKELINKRNQILDFDNLTDEQKRMSYQELVKTLPEKTQDKINDIDFFIQEIKDSFKVTPDSDINFYVKFLILGIERNLSKYIIDDPGKHKTKSKKYFWEILLDELESQLLENPENINPNVLDELINQLDKISLKDIDNKTYKYKKKRLEITKRSISNYLEKDKNKISVNMKQFTRLVFDLKLIDSSECLGYPEKANRIKEIVELKGHSIFGKIKIVSISKNIFKSIYDYIKLFYGEEKPYFNDKSEKEYQKLKKELSSLL